MNQIIYLLQHTRTENIIQFILIFFIIYFLLILIKTSLLQKINHIAHKTNTEIDDLLIKIINSYGPLFYLFIPLYLTSIISSISASIDNFLYKVSIIFFTYYIVKALNIFIDYGFQKLLAKQKINQQKDPTILRILNSLSQILLWLIAILFILQNFHYNISTLVGGLGITGVAIAFGLQNFLRDIFAFFSIYIDKPFNVGDVIEIDNHFATVKHIGIRSTRLKTNTGDELIIPNQTITQTKIRNFKKLKTRRIELIISIPYDTPTEKLTKIPQIIKKIITHIDLIKFQRCHLKKIEKSTLIYEIVYYLKSPSYMTYMDIRQQINLEIIEHFKKNKISII